MSQFDQGPTRAFRRGVQVSGAPRLGSVPLTAPGVSPVPVSFRPDAGPVLATQLSTALGQAGNTLMFAGNLAQRHRNELAGLGAEEAEKLRPVLRDQILNGDIVPEGDIIPWAEGLASQFLDPDLPEPAKERFRKQLVPDLVAAGVAAERDAQDRLDTDAMVRLRSAISSSTDATEILEAYNESFEVMPNISQAQRDEMLLKPALSVAASTGNREAFDRVAGVLGDRMAGVQNLLRARLDESEARAHSQAVREATQGFTDALDGILDDAVVDYDAAEDLLEAFDDDSMVDAGAKRSYRDRIRSGKKAQEAETLRAEASAFREDIHAAMSGEGAVQRVSDISEQYDTLPQSVRTDAVDAVARDRISEAVQAGDHRGVGEYTAFLSDTSDNRRFAAEKREEVMGVVRNATTGALFGTAMFIQSSAYNGDDAAVQLRSLTHDAAARHAAFLADEFDPAGINSEQYRYIINSVGQSVANVTQREVGMAAGRAAWTDFLKGADTVRPDMGRGEALGLAAEAGAVNTVGTGDKLAFTGIEQPEQLASMIVAWRGIMPSGVAEAIGGAFNQHRSVTLPEARTLLALHRTAPEYADEILNTRANGSVITPNGNGAARAFLNAARDRVPAATDPGYAEAVARVLNESMAAYQPVDDPFTVQQAEEHFREHATLMPELVRSSISTVLPEGFDDLFSPFGLFGPDRDVTDAPATMVEEFKRNLHQAFTEFQNSGPAMPDEDAREAAGLLAAARTLRRFKPLEWDNDILFREAPEAGLIQNFDDRARVLLESAIDRNRLDTDLSVNQIMAWYKPRWDRAAQAWRLDGGSVRGDLETVDGQPYLIREDTEAYRRLEEHIAKISEAIGDDDAIRALREAAHRRANENSVSYNSPYNVVGLGQSLDDLQRELTGR